jgi:hypothetical protein
MIRTDRHALEWNLINPSLFILKNALRIRCSNSVSFAYFFNISSITCVDVATLFLSCLDIISGEVCWSITLHVTSNIICICLKVSQEVNLKWIMANWEIDNNGIDAAMVDWWNIAVVMLLKFVLVISHYSISYSHAIDNKVE